MKKFLSILLFGIIAIISTISPIFAENYHYKLYNPETKEVSSATIITISGPENSYVIGFLVKGAPGPCLIYSTENKENGLLGGRCIVMGGNNTYLWKEYQPNTFNSELKSIIKERRTQGSIYLMKQ